MAIRWILGSDHGGFELKEAIQQHLLAQGFVVTDQGTTTADQSVDYPDYAKAVADAVLADPNALGILVCGTGIGMSIAANKIPGIRAALCHNPMTAKMARRHNNANILVLGGRVLSVAEGLAVVDAFIAAEFEGGRHAGRLEKIRELEAS
jgi:ribose 5-phosphate isomerase B